jgi:Holliday junction resolvase RusA-like endonuclease
LPPSVNHLWRTGRGKVYRSSTYDAWRKEAGWELQVQKPGRVEGAVEVTISAGKPDCRRRDCDNLPKAILDLLTAHQVIADDSLVASITARWDTSVPAGRAIVTIKGDS